MVSRFTVPAIAVGLLLSGCGGSSGTTAAQPSAVATAVAATSAAATPSAAATRTASPSAVPTRPGAVRPPGSKLVTDKANGYQLALPAVYLRITSKAQLNKVAKAGASAVRRSGITQQMLNKSVKMIAARLDEAGSVNVVVVPAQGLTADQLPLAEPTIKKQLKSLGARGVTFASATLGGDPALRISYTLKAQGRRVSTVQYMTVHADRSYTLTFTEPVRLASKIEKQTVASWQFL
jgi:hypothetical protein